MFFMFQILVGYDVDLLWFSFLVVIVYMELSWFCEDFRLIIGCIW